TGTGPMFEVVARDVGDLCVRVVATDSLGARSEEATLALTVSNNAPTADLRALAPRSPSGKMRLYARVELSAAGSRDPDGDRLTYSWVATRPDGQSLALAPCDAAIPDEARRCFSASVPGHYQASVTANDGLRDSAPQTVGLDVDEDLPPCLIKSDPQTLQPVALVPAGGKRTFEVLVV